MYDYDADDGIDWLGMVGAATILLVFVLAVIEAGMDRKRSQATCPPSADGKQHVSSQYSPDGKLVACYYAKTGPGVATEKKGE